MKVLECSDRDPVPQLRFLPSGQTPRLIDVGLMHYEASIAGFSERYRRGETSHTIHVWWARRPHAAMRALVFASVAKTCDAETGHLLQALATTGRSPSTISFNQSLQQGYTATPKVLDMFGGGGTIPFEAAALGLEAHSLDVNALSVLIQKCNLQLSQNLDPTERAQLVESTGRNVLVKVQAQTEELFPGRQRQILAYLWTYRLTCSKCSFGFLLMKRPWLTRKRGKCQVLVRQNREAAEDVKILDADALPISHTNWLGRKSIARCPKCTTDHANVDIRNCEDSLVALVQKVQPTGKKFLISNPQQDYDQVAVSQVEAQLLAQLNVCLPNSEIPKWSGVVNPALYGMATHADAMNQRQRVVMLTLIKELRAAYHELLASRGESVARFVVAALSGLIDQLVDWNCRLSTWIAQNEQVGRAFCGPGVAMYWDYVEIDPLLKGPANLWDKLKRIVAGISAIPTFPCTPSVQLGYAQSLPYASETFDAVVSDPPYYDNIYYSILADFFYAWKRLLFLEVDSQAFAAGHTDATHELVASTFRARNPQEAHAEYCTQLTVAITEAARVMRTGAVFSLVYSHSSIAGWEAIVKAYRAAPLFISSVQPLSIERKHRPRAVFSDAVNTCVVFVARKSAQAKPAQSAAGLRAELTAILDGGFGDGLKKAGWNERDIGVAIFAQGVALLANCRHVEPGDPKLMRRFGDLVSERYPTFKVSERKSL